jgi:hypothetical protein
MHDGSREEMTYQETIDRLKEVIDTGGFGTESRIARAAGMSARAINRFKHGEYTSERAEVLSDMINRALDGFDPVWVKTEDERKANIGGALDGLHDTLDRLREAIAPMDGESTAVYRAMEMALLKGIRAIRIKEGLEFVKHVT